MKFLVALTFILASVACGAQDSNISVQQSFTQYIQTTSTNADAISNFTEIKRTLGVEGSPLLLPDWYAGRIFFTNGTVMEEPTKSLNFNKMKKGLLVKLSAENVLEVNMTPISYFTLTDGTTSWTFRQLPGKPGDFAIEIQAGAEFSTYKSISTQFFKSDYQNKGLYETGSKYDRYVDEVKYFIFDKTGKMTEVDKTDVKGIKKLGKDLPGAKAFFAKNEFDTEKPDKSMKDLTTFLNSNPG